MDGERGMPGALQKLVLARTLMLRAADPIPVDALMARLVLTQRHRLSR